MITNSYFKKRGNLEEQQAQLQDQFLRGRTDCLHDLRNTSECHTDLFVQYLFTRRRYPIFLKPDGTKLYYLQENYTKTICWAVCLGGEQMTVVQKETTRVERRHIHPLHSRRHKDGRKPSKRKDLRGSSPSDRKCQKAHRHDLKGNCTNRRVIIGILPYVNNTKRIGLQSGRKVCPSGTLRVKSRRKVVEKDLLP